MANIRITDKPELQQFDNVAFLVTNKAEYPQKDYQVSGEGLAKIVSGNIIYDVSCGTAGDAVTKEVTIEKFKEQVPGTVIWVTFTFKNTAVNPVLSINGGKGIPLKVQGNNVPPLFIEAGRKYKLEFIDKSWNFINQAQSDSEIADRTYGVSKDLDDGDYDVDEIKELGRYTWTSKAPLINIPGRDPKLNTWGSLTVTKVGSGNDRKQVINFGQDNTQFSRTNPGGDNAWGKWQQTVTDDMLGGDVSNINKKIADIISGATPVKKVSSTATKNGVEIADVNQLSDGTVSVISDTATNVSKSRVAFRSDTYTKQEVDDIVSTVYKYKGSVPTYADLPKSGNKVGDVYNVEDTGLNWAWDGKKWDELGMNIDTSKLVTKSDVMDDNSIMLWDGSKAKTMSVPEGSKGKVLVYNGPDQEPTFEKYKTAASWTGTSAEFEEAKKETDPESDNYIADMSIVNITDDGQTGNIASIVALGDYNPVTSDGVAKSLSNGSVTKVSDNATKGGSEIATTDGTVESAKRAYMSESDEKDLDKIRKPGWYIFGGNTLMNAPVSGTNCIFKVYELLPNFLYEEFYVISGKGLNGNKYIRSIYGTGTAKTKWKEVATVQQSPAQASYSTFDYGIEGETK